ncbi:MAG: tRNA anti-like [Chthoniobacter sp.]|jgi:hypothetical protein|nr:tRNA anti-like [Chthoniobacter sp.]
MSFLAAEDSATFASAIPMDYRPLIYLLCCWFLISGAIQAQSSTAGEAEAQKCEDRIAAVQRDVFIKYDDALAELQAGLQKTADLEGALAVRAERQRVAQEQVLSEANLAAEPKTLRALQAQTIARMQEMVKQLVAETLPKLVEFKKQLTVAGKLDEAVAVRAAIEKLQNAHVPVARPDAGSIVPAETLLVAYGGDRARADKTYKGQKMIVRGVVGGFRADPADAKNYQVFLTGGTTGGWVQCTFHGGDHRFREEKAAFNVAVLVITSKDTDSGGARLQKGSPLDVRGICEGWDEVVRMNKCEVPK